MRVPGFWGSGVPGSRFWVRLGAKRRGRSPLGEAGTVPAALALLLVALLGVTAAAQTVLDRVIVRFGGEIVTQLDVRQARLLKLVQVPNDTEEAYVDALVNRRLILADLRRAGVAEPTAADIAGRRAAWASRLGTGADVADLLSRAAMSEAALTGWLRDDVRIDDYVTKRFGGRSVDLENWITVLRQRAGLK